MLIFAVSYEKDT